MRLIAEIKVTDTNCINHIFHIMVGTDNDREPFYEVIKTEPEVKEIASTEGFEQALQEISTSLFLDEIDVIE